MMKIAVSRELSHRAASFHSEAIFLRRFCSLSSPSHLRASSTSILVRQHIMLELRLPRLNIITTSTTNTPSRISQWSSSTTTPSQSMSSTRTRSICRIQSRSAPTSTSWSSSILKLSIQRDTVWPWRITANTKTTKLNRTDTTTTMELEASLMKLSNTLISQQSSTTRPTKKLTTKWRQQSAVQCLGNLWYNCLLSGLSPWNP